MGKVFGYLSKRKDKLPDLRVKSYLQRTGDFFKEIKVDKVSILLSWKNNDFFKIIKHKDLFFIFDGFDCSIYSCPNVAEKYLKEGAHRFFHN